MWLSMVEPVALSEWLADCCDQQAVVRHEVVRITDSSVTALGCQNTVTQDVVECLGSGAGVGVPRDGVCWLERPETVHDREFLAAGQIGQAASIIVLERLGRLAARGTIEASEGAGIC